MTEFEKKSNSKELTPIQTTPIYTATGDDKVVLSI